MVKNINFFFFAEIFNFCKKIFEVPKKKNLKTKEKTKENESFKINTKKFEILPFQNEFFVSFKTYCV